MIVQYPTLGDTPQDLSMVENALNERTEPEIGVHVTFYPVSAFETNNVTSRMVFSNEKLDLAISIFEGGVAGYVNQGALLPLDDLVEQYGQDILAAEGIAMAGGYFDGTLYGIPTEEKMARVKAFECRRDLLEKYEIEYDENKVYTAEELSDIFAIVQAGEGGAFHCIAANGSEDALYSFFDHTDQLGASYASGVLMDYGTGKDEIVNYFETEEFGQFCNTVRSWFQNGYLSQDCNTTTDSALILYRGIEGVHYNFAEGSDCVVEFPEGIDQSNTPYAAILNVWGDKIKDYVMAPLDETYYDSMARFNASVTEDHVSNALGYCFNSDPVKTQYANVNDVVTQYKATLGMGVVDPATELETFRSELKAAGIDDVIAANQGQYAEWKAAQ